MVVDPPSIVNKIQTETPAVPLQEMKVDFSANQYITAFIVRLISENLENRCWAPFRN
jgi:hypothetical protein